MPKPTYANVAGSGPAGQRCATCDHWVPSVVDPRPGQRVAMVCEKVAEQTCLPATRLGTAESHTPACKYWARRRAAPPAQPAQSEGRP
ncbi:hypothetical protein [uncultured Rhodospira sp.]|uniref:hypothetical protein n=1 Tax=uncultured Rhodospira sp. TaxID=1936189 RepID=UPI00262464A4|nr:hypothetical protein [uncultured Rhodospira sp.]